MLTIEDRWPCVFCSNRRTVRWNLQVKYCFNCHRRWRSPVEAAPFSNDELARLRAYRAAIQAGFHSDQLRAAD
jgi:hypothetical protein